MWCQDINVSLNVSKTKELIVDNNINWAVVERAKRLKFLGVYIINKLSWSKHTKTVVKRAQHHLEQGESFKFLVSTSTNYHGPNIPRQS